MVKKEYSYRGHTLPELKKMSLVELAGLFPSKQRRTIKRGLTEEQKKLLKNLKTSQKMVKTHCRDIIILPEMIDKMIKVYNGKEFIVIKILPEMIGHLLGEFALTRRKIAHNAPGVGATRSSASVSVR